MFWWYRRAKICYTYLEDVSIDASTIIQQTSIRKSKYWTRAWTLQELVAPENVVFYATNWDRLGSKSDFHVLLKSITGIEEKVLRTGVFEDVSIANRMSWAAGRKAAREEDKAYSLLGIFDVNMPLLYGEGLSKAFIRLQEEIMRRSDDQSLFAWGLPANEPLQSMEFYSSVQGFPEAYTSMSSSKRRDSREERLSGSEGRSLLGLLAASPDDFANSRRIRQIRGIDELTFSMPPMTTNRGIRIDLPFFPHGFAFMTRDDVAEYEYECDTCYEEAWLSFAIIACCDQTNSESTLGIPLLAWSRRRFARLGSPVLIPAERWPPKLAKITRTLLIREPDRVKSENRVSKFVIWKWPSPESNYVRTNSIVASHAEYDRDRQLLTVPERSEGRVHAAFYFTHKRRPGFAVILGGRPEAGLPHGPWAACVGITTGSTGRNASRQGEESLLQRGQLDIICASWTQVLSMVQHGRVDSHGRSSDSLLAQLWERKSHRFREMIEFHPTIDWVGAYILVVEVDMSMEPVNFAEVGVHVEINVSHNPGQDFDEKRKPPTRFLMSRSAEAKVTRQ